MKKEHLIIIIEYLFVFCIVLDFNTVYREFEWFIKATNILSLLTITLLLVLNVRNVKLSQTVVLYLCGALIPLFNISTDAISSYVRTFIMMVPFMTLYFQANKKEGRYYSLLICFCNIMLVEALISLFFWYEGSIQGVVAPNLYMPYDWNPYKDFQLIPSFYGIYFETQYSHFLGNDIARNSGIFMEGPMHNMALCVALIIECFIKTKTSIWRMCVFVVAVVTTLTTTGYIFLMLMLMIYVYNHISRRYRVIVLLFLIPMIFLGFLTALNIKEEEGGEASLMSRQADIEKCIDVGLENPILGVGVFRKNVIYLSSPDFYGYSNSIFTVFAHGGFYLLTLYISLLFIIPLIRYMSGKDIKWAITLLLFFVVFAITVSHYRMLTFMFLALSLSNIQIKKLHR